MCTPQRSLISHNILSILREPTKKHCSIKRGVFALLGVLVVYKGDKNLLRIAWFKELCTMCSVHGYSLAFWV